jgi:tRNA(His) guanylyltransferase
MSKDSLGDRMKMYERLAAGQVLMPLAPIACRIDGRAFHTFTKRMMRPHDESFCKLMVDTTKYLVEETGAKIGYTQSDEISLIWYSEEISSEILFDRRTAKMTSVLAAMATAYFNRHLPHALPDHAASMPLFDCRVWQLPAKFEATNYLVWREADATRNSVSMAAQACFSHNALQGKNSSQMQEMLFSEKGINWNDYPACQKRGTYIRRAVVERPFEVKELERLPKNHEAHRNPDLMIKRQQIQVLDIPPLRRIKNRDEVIFEGAEPVLRTDS